MAITLAEIQQGVAENPELKNEIFGAFETELPDYLKGKSYLVRTADDDEKEFGKRIGSRVKELYGGVENDVLTEFGEYGVKKDHAEEKVYDLIKKAKAKTAATIQGYKEQIAALGEGKVDQVSKAKIEALEAQVEALGNEKTELQNQFSQKELASRSNSEFDKAYSKLRITVPANVADKDKDDYIANKQAMLKSTLLAKYKPTEENGSIVYKDSDGNIAMKGANVATAEDLLADNFKYDFEAATKTGTGSKGTGQNNVPTIVSNKAQLYEQLAKEGLPMGSKEWTERATKLSEENKIEL